ncbi:MAG: hypothetical protein LCH91_20665 [Bacteroidetes bacterium]|nr:hypothetical protein [Bacteroidota bacterium]
MKSFITTIAAVALLGTTSVMAQLNSPHNYKRPVSQKSTTKSANIVVEDRVAPLKLNNNVASVHNYKRQGSANFQQESIVALSAPVIGNSPQNPTALPNYYKSQFKPTVSENRSAIKVKKDDVKTDTLAR